MERALRHRLNAGEAAVKAQLPFFRKHFGQLPTEWKPDDTRVTFADFAISERLLADLSQLFPEDNFCSEEGNPADETLALDSRFAWILDPIDGTNNYALGLPNCALSLGLLERGRPCYGWIYDYARDVILHGGPGHGLYQGSEHHTPPEDPPLSRRESLFSIQFPLPEALWSQLGPLMTGYRVRSLGSSALALAYTALGDFDGCVDARGKIWDYAAGLALIAAHPGREVRLLQEAPLFPLKAFHVDAPSILLAAGSSAFWEALSGAPHFASSRDVFGAA